MTETETNYRETALQVENLIRQLQEAKAVIKEKEAEISELKSKTKTIEEVTIPDILFEHGYNGINLLSGVRVDIRPIYHARVNKENPQPFYSWLRANGHGAIIRSHFEQWINDPEQEALLRYILQEFKVPYTVGEGINWKTLEAWFKEQSQKGEQLPLQLFENYVGRRAYIK